MNSSASDKQTDLLAKQANEAQKDAAVAQDRMGKLNDSFAKCVDLLAKNP